jgi:hypothetical protein
MSTEPKKSDLFQFEGNNKLFETQFIYTIIEFLRINYKILNGINLVKIFISYRFFL